MDQKRCAKSMEWFKDYLWRIEEILYFILADRTGARYDGRCTAVHCAAPTLAVTFMLCRFPCTAVNYRPKGPTPL